MVATAATVHPNAGEPGIGESWAHRSESFARDGFALSDGPVLPPDVVARARASFEAIVAKADVGAYPPEGSMTLPHVQGVVAGGPGRGRRGRRGRLAQGRDASARSLRARHRRAHAPPGARGVVRGGDGRRLASVLVDTAARQATVRARSHDRRRNFYRLSSGAWLRVLPGFSVQANICRGVLSRTKITGSARSTRWRRATSRGRARSSRRGWLSPTWGRILGR
jgi:hypothetical protein